MSAQSDLDGGSTRVRPSLASLPLSGIALVASNLLPIVGVLFWAWNVYVLLLLFWLENIVVGLFNLLRMASARGGDLGSQLSKVFVLPFFTFHYGLFTLVHGVLLISLFGGDLAGGGNPALNGANFRLDTLLLIVWLDVRAYHLAWPLLALVLSHGFSFVSNYLGGGEYERVEPQQLMARPYSRIIALHLTILLGGFVAMATGSHWAALLLLIGIKIGVDLQAHLAERRKLVGADAQPPSVIGSARRRATSG